VIAPRTLFALALAALALGCGQEQPAEAAGFPEKDRAAEAERLLAGPDWYRHAIVYEVYVRSFQDSDGDGIGDLRGLVSRLDALEELGVDALWLMPITPTPFKDSGYDVADYQDVDPDYGSLEDFDELIAAARSRGIRVLVDLVLNHTSDQHPWFVESRASTTNPKASWYVWSDTEGDPEIGCGVASPTFGSSAWSYDPQRKQYYFHRFYPEQPDLNYRNPEVVGATLDAARFWLERGADGFRCDVIGMLYESPTSCMMVPETVEYIKRLRALLDEYPDRAMVAESSAFSSAADYFGNGRDMFQLAFNFGYGYFWGSSIRSGTARNIAAIFEQARDEYPPGAQDALVIGSHDVPRAHQTAQGIESRARRAAVIQMTMPGTPFVYYGEELGLRPGSDKVVDARDSARTPMLWSSAPGFGFTTGSPWLAFGAEPETTNLEHEQSDPGSMLAFYRELLAFRRGREAFGTGSLIVTESDQPAVLWYARASSDEEYVVGVSLDEEQASIALGPAPDWPATPVRVLGQGELVQSKGVAMLSLPAAGWGVFRVR
jgi:alpha-glucosidase